MPQLTGNANQQAIRRPQYSSNEWLSHGFRRALNEEELALQREAHAYLKLHPDEAVQVQLEQIYRQMAYLNARMQMSEARKTAAEYRTYTVELNLLGNAESGAVDQILPGNPARREMELYASNGSIFICWERLQSIPDPSKVSALQVNRYAFIPEAVRWPIRTISPLYAISSSNQPASQATLTIVEELYSLPKTLRGEYGVAMKHEADKVQKNDWLEDLDAAAVDRRKVGHW